MPNSAEQTYWEQLSLKAGVETKWHFPTVLFNNDTRTASPRKTYENVLKVETSDIPKTILIVRKARKYKYYIRSLKYSSLNCSAPNCWWDIFEF